MELITEKCYNMEVNLYRDYKIIDKFVCQGKLMVTVKIKGNVHVMEIWELKRWKNSL